MSCPESIFTDEEEELDPHGCIAVTDSNEEGSYESEE